MRVTTFEKPIFLMLGLETEKSEYFLFYFIF